MEGQTWFAARGSEALSLKEAARVAKVSRVHGGSVRSKRTAPAGSHWGVACRYLARYKRPLKPLMEATAVCRNIKILFNFTPPATDEEIRAASLQFVRKLSGFNSPSLANRAAFDRAVNEVAESARALIGALVTTAEPRDREVEAERARARAALRFGARRGSQVEG
jgi:hypothetical protein